MDDDEQLLEVELTPILKVAGEDAPLQPYWVALDSSTVVEKQSVDWDGRAAWALRRPTSTGPGGTWVNLNRDAEAYANRSDCSPAYAAGWAVALTLETLRQEAEGRPLYQEAIDEVYDSVRGGRWEDVFRFGDDVGDVEEAPRRKFAEGIYNGRYEVGYPKSRPGIPDTPRWNR